MHRLPDAIAEALALFAPLSSERISLFEATGRRLARDVVARVSVPPFHASAMDGYAVLAEDVASATETAPVALEVTIEAPAGRPSTEVVTTGIAARVLTGSAMPEGADAIVIQENVSREGSRILVRVPAKRGANLRAEGSDIAAGSVILTRGMRLDAGAIAMLASQEIAQPECVRRPVVAILPTGDELRGIGEGREYGAIIDSNAPMLASLVAREGAIPRVLPIVRDDRAAIAASVAAALDADLVITTGGVSVGDHDHVPDALTSLGADLLVRKVRMKPGKPVTVASLAGRPILGLPGNPASAMVAFELFVAPGLRRMQGDETPFADGDLLPLAATLERSTGRPELARGRYVVRDGIRHVDLGRTQGSGSLRALTVCDALVLLAAETARVEAGALVYALPVGGRGDRARSPLGDRPELAPRADG